ncbi:flagellar M-ring protein FliF [Lachnospiraceae bacterium XBB2008]|nr:flagellar M-ring protein FliF [Lachnospiraceae bacterium XBB2008]
MAERLRAIWARIQEWWNRFTTRQKTIIIVVAAVVLIAIGILIAVLTRDKYVTIFVAETTEETNAVTAILEENSITNKVSDDGLSVMILEEDQAQANLLLGSNSFKSSAYSIDNVTDGGISTTEANTQRKYVLYLESRLENDFISDFEAIKSAHVELHIPTDDGTLIAKQEEASASILLDLEEEFTPEQASYLARAVATAIGNESTNNIVIMDNQGNMLFSGEDNYSTAGTTGSQLTVKSQAETAVKNEVRSVLLGTKEFDEVEVACTLIMDFSTREDTDHTYTPAEGQKQGVLAHEETYASDSANSGGGVPGTDSNTENDTTYVIQDNSRSNSSVSEELRDYLPNEHITVTTTPAGLIDYTQSSIALTAIQYNIIREEDAETQGLLDGITWEEYKLANNTRTKLDVEDDLVDVVSKATGIPVARIAFAAYSQNVFFDKEGSTFSVTDFVQIALIIVILALLAFVVLRSMQREKEEAPQEELSVEDLLQSTPETELEDIAMEDESETKKAISKFVEDNPEAAALLLRNWLNEEWG